MSAGSSERRERSGKQGRRGVSQCGSRILPCWILGFSSGVKGFKESGESGDGSLETKSGIGNAGDSYPADWRSRECHRRCGKFFK